MTATLGTERVAATLAFAEPVARKRLAAHGLQQPETELVELLVTGCAREFRSRQASWSEVDREWRDANTF